MKIENQSFETILKSFLPDFDIKTVFDDFLTITIISLTSSAGYNPAGYYENYAAALSKYLHDPRYINFAHAFKALGQEMEARKAKDQSTDILGEFYFKNVVTDSVRKFLEWDECIKLANSSFEKFKKSERSKRFLHSSCGSGILLLAVKKRFPQTELLFGLDTDIICVKMTALNLFLHGVFISEAILGRVNPYEFKSGFVISDNPFGIFPIKKKEDSLLWDTLRKFSE